MRLRTLEEARKALLGKQGRIPERKEAIRGAGDECSKCKGQGYFQNVWNSYECSRCHGSGVYAPVVSYRGTGVFERKVGTNARLYETAEGFIELRLHETVVARWTPWWVELRTDGWSTALTKQVLNDFTPADIHTAGLWYVADGPLHRRSDGCYDYSARDYITFFDGIRLDSKGYVLNPPYMGEQRAWEALALRPDYSIRAWARETIRRSRRGHLARCERCDQDLNVDGAIDECVDLDHVLDHFMRGEHTAHGLFTIYVEENQGAPKINDFARYVWEELELTASHRQDHLPVQKMERPGFGAFSRR